MLPPSKKSQWLPSAVGRSFNSFKKPFRPSLICPLFPFQACLPLWPHLITWAQQTTHVHFHASVHFSSLDCLWKSLTIQGLVQGLVQIASFWDGFFDSERIYYSCHYTHKAHCVCLCSVTVTCEVHAFGTKQTWVSVLALSLICHVPFGKSRISKLLCATKSKTKAYLTE